MGWRVGEGCATLAPLATRMISSASELLTQISITIKAIAVLHGTRKVFYSCDLC